MKHKSHIKSILYTLISSYVIYWMYIGLLYTPYFKEQIETIQYFSSTTENWSFVDYILFFGLNLFMILMTVYFYFIFLVPFLTMSFFPNLYEELKDNKIAMFKLHIYQVVITIGMYLLFKYEYSV